MANSIPNNYYPISSNVFWPDAEKLELTLDNTGQTNADYLVTATNDDPAHWNVEPIMSSNVFRNVPPMNQDTDSTGPGEETSRWQVYALPGASDTATVTFTLYRRDALLRSRCSTR